MTDRSLPERKEIKTSLRQMGLSNRQVDALLRHGWRGLVSETQAEADELRDKLAEVSARFGSVN